MDTPLPNPTALDIGTRELRDHLAEYLAQAKAGAAFTVTQRGEAVARLLPPADATMPFGALAGRIRMAPDFDETPADLIAAMEGEAPTG